MEKSLLRSASKTFDCKEVTVIIPVYKENPDTLAKIYADLREYGFKVLIVDDGNSMSVPSWLPSITYDKHMGYGYAIKYGIAHSKTQTICVFDGDGQHIADDALKLYMTYKMVKDCKMVIGQRWNVQEPLQRRMGRKFLNFIASCIAGHYMVDLNSGLRVFDATLAKNYSPILCDTFSFTTSLTMSFVTDDYKTVYIPINVQPRQFGKSHVKVIKDGFITLKYILVIGLALRTRWIRKKIRDTASRWMRKPIGAVVA